MKRTIILISILVAVLAAVGGGVLWYRSNTGSRLLTRAQLAWRANNPGKVRDLMDKYVADNPNDWRGYYWRAQSFLMEGRFAEAHAALDRAAEADATEAAIPLLRADCFNREAGKKSSSTSPAELREAEMLFGKALAALEADAESVDGMAVEFGKSVALTYRDLAATYGRMADILSRQAATEKAREPGEFLADAWTDALAAPSAEISPARRAKTLAMAREILGFAPASAERSEDDRRRFAEDVGRMVAGREATDAMARQAMVALARTRLLRVLADASEAGRTPEPSDVAPAAELCDRVLAPQADPRDFQALAARAAVARVQQNVALKRAAETFLATLREDPSEAGVAAEAVRLCLSFRDRRDAEAVRAVLEPLAEAPAMAALMLAEDDLRAATQQHAPGPALREQLGQTYRLAGDILQANPDDVTAKMMRAKLALMLGEFDTVETLGGELAEMRDPAWAAKYGALLLGQRLLAVEGAAAAAPRLLKLTTEYPNSPEALFAYALAALETGESQSASDALTRLIQMGEDKFLTPVIGAAGRAVLVADAKLNRAELALRLGQAAPAAAACKDVLQHISGHQRAWLLNLWAAWRADPANDGLLMRFVLAANGSDYRRYAEEAVVAFEGEIDVVREGLAAKVRRAREAADVVGARTAAEIAAKVAEARRNPDAPQTAQQAYGAWAEAVKGYGRCLAMLRWARGCWSILGDNERAEAACEAMAALPRFAADDRFLLARALHAAGRGDQAADVLRGEIDAHGDDPGGRIRFALAALLAGRGRTDEALDALAPASEDGVLKGKADLMKMALLAGAGRLDSANETAAALQAAAVADGDADLLLEVAGFHARTNQPAELAAALGPLTDLVRGDSGASMRVLSLIRQVRPASRGAALCRKMIGQLAGDDRISLAYVVLADLLDVEQDRTGALAVLDELKNLPGSERLRKMHRAEALFHEGELLTRWGLYERAAASYQALVAEGQQGSPRAMLALARNMARLDQRTQAAKVLLDIPRDSSQFLAGQLLLADLQPTPEAKLAALWKLSQIQPTNETILLRRMGLLLETGRPEAAVGAYEAFAARQGPAYRPTTAAPLAALETMWKASDRKKAAVEALRLAAMIESPAWRVTAALLAMDADSPAAGTLLETVWKDRSDVQAPTRADFTLALTGVAWAGSAADAEAVARWASRYDTLVGRTTAAGATVPVAPGDQLLVALAAGAADRTDTLLAGVKDVWGSGVEPAELLAATAAEDPAAAGAAARLLAASVAGRLPTPLPWLSRSLAMDVLNERPACQWAAAIAEAGLSTAAQKDERLAGFQTIASLEPLQGSCVAEAAQARALVEQARDQEAAALFGRIADRTKLPVARLEQAMAFERAGEMEEAIGAYERLWETSPVAANNLAYLLLSTGPDDAEQLARAGEYAAAAAKAGDVPAFHDTCGWIAYRQGRTDQAVEQLCRAVRGIPRDPAVHYHLGLAEAAAGRDRLAKWHLSAAASIGQAAADRGDGLDRDAAEAVAAAKAELGRMGAGG